MPRTFDLEIDFINFYFNFIARSLNCMSISCRLHVLNTSTLLESDSCSSIFWTSQSLIVRLFDNAFETFSVHSSRPFVWIANQLKLIHLFRPISLKFKVRRSAKVNIKAKKLRCWLENFYWRIALRGLEVFKWTFRSRLSNTCKTKLN